MPPPKSRVARELFAELMDLGRQFDANPQLRALMTSSLLHPPVSHQKTRSERRKPPSCATESPQSAASASAECFWHHHNRFIAQSLFGASSSSTSLVLRLYDAYLRGDRLYPPSGFYWPSQGTNKDNPSSMCELIQRGFEQCRHSEQLDGWFRALGTLNDRLELARKLGICSERDVSEDPAVKGDVHSDKEASPSSSFKSQSNDSECSESSKREVRLAQDLAPGVLLIAHPMMPPPFARAVILLTDYSPKGFVEGLIINNSTKGPLTSFVVTSDQVTDEMLQLFGSNHLRTGGPILSDKGSSAEMRASMLPRQSIDLYMLHSHPEIGGRSIFNNPVLNPAPEDVVYLGMNLELAVKAVQDNRMQPQDVVFIGGKSGWRPGQLEEEMKLGVWIAVHAPHSWAFSATEYLWNDMLIKLGGDFAKFGTMPRR